MEKEILLTNNKSKTNGNKENIIFFHLEKNGRLLPYDSIESNINLLDVYNYERNSSNKIRLTFQINPICTNVLFNNKTEIVKYEGSDNCINLNYQNNLNVDGTIGKKNNFNWNQREAIKDTQLSNSACGFTYYCGRDIFNNHIIRNKSFKCSISGKDSDVFNTLFDYLKDDEGGIIKGYKINNPNEEIDLHLYLKEEVDTFEDSVKNNLIEKNGWFGFTNTSKLRLLKDDVSYNNKNDYNKPINNHESCDFIEMYPDSSLYSFNPKYNKYRNRLEYNWKCCLTYPSSSTTEGFDFINSAIDSLKILYFIEKDDSIRFYCICKHNLSLGDYVNIYNNTSLLLEKMEVSSLGTDDGKNKEFIFSVLSKGNIISNNWHNISLGEYTSQKIIISGNTYNIENNKLVKNGINSYYIVERSVNLDDNYKNLSFKKISEGEEVDYYVRIFSKIPNWKYATTQVNEYNIYDNTETSGLLTSCQSYLTDFESHITKMAFAKNIYNDDVSQIVYNDDVDISHLKDNLKRPISDIYLTIIKNNNGYEKWYGKNNNVISVTDKSIEYSHCFGKVTCAFELSKHSMVDDNLTNLLLLNNVNDNSKNFHQVKGYDINKINNVSGFNDEIKYEDSINFYGDLCEFSRTSQNETSIQMIGFRFNTAQRELDNTYSSMEYYDNLYYDEIKYDDYDYNSFTKEENSYANACKEREGYYYFPHYKIPINTFSNTIQTGFPLMASIKNISPLGNGNFKIFTKKINGLENNDKFVLFDGYYGKYYNGVVYSDGIITDNLFKAKLDDDFLLNSNLKVDYLQILNPRYNNIPVYANLIKDGTTRYVWKDILHNGNDTDSNIETYPFTNGRLYINSNINIYLLRQDPKYDSRKYTDNGGSLIKTNDKLLSPSGNTISTASTNNYNTSSAMTC